MMNSIPGPYSVLGPKANMFKFFRRPFTFQRWLHDTYGSIVALGQGSKPSTVFAFGPEMNRQILTNPDFFEVSSAFVKIPQNTVLGDMFYHNLMLMSGQKHRQHRRLMQPAFQHDQIVRYGQDMAMITERLADEWRGRTEIELNAEMKKLTQRIAVKTLFGMQDEHEMDHMGELIYRLTKSILLVTLAPVNIPLTPYHRALGIAGQLNERIRSMIHNKRQHLDSKPDVLAALIRAHDEDGTALTDEELVGHTFSLYVAGHETTANALTWTLFLLIQHPEVYSGVMDELNAVLNGDPPALEQLGRLPLLDGVIKEGLRLMPPASIGTRITAAPSELGGYSLPERTNVFF
ncbi:cytochrome P450 [Paenibacillus sp. DMB20]|uniref:cytochrome P450 n=1 Tax=Paenibacillus sp. DMB20 TaxID=1642570 RepID=UPI002286B2EE|nr:cytochrome P450 [Paenibacillus sp. DMB20]